MDTKIIEIISTQGAWAVLSVTLIFYILKAQEKREENYQKMIFELTEELKIISEINDHVKNIIPKD